MVAIKCAIIFCHENSEGSILSHSRLSSLTKEEKCAEFLNANFRTIEKQ